MKCTSSVFLEAIQNELNANISCVCLQENFTGYLWTSSVVDGAQGTDVAEYQT